MKKLFVIGAAAIVTTGCSPLMHAGAAGPYRPMPPGFYGPSRISAPLPTGRWDNVMRLPRASTIDVLTRDGGVTIGLIAGSDVESVRLLADGADVTIARSDIIRVDLVDLAGSDALAVARKAARGAVLGAGAAALVTGVLGGRHWPPPGHALRAGAAMGAVAGGETEMTQRAGRLLYLAPDEGARSFAARPVRNNQCGCQQRVIPEPNLHRTPR